MKKLKFKYNVDERPEKKSETIALSIQHVFAMFGSTILVPTLIGIDVATALVTAGLGTLIYTQVTKNKVPVFIGSSFAYIAVLTMLNETAGPAGVSMAVLSVGIIYCLIAFLISLAGTSWIDKILPPVVIGPIIIIIGLGLAPIAIANSGLSVETFDVTSIIISMSSLMATILALLIGNKQMKMIPIIFGIAVGYIVAILLGQVDLSVIFSQGLFNVPDFQVPGVTYDFVFDISILISVIPLVLVTMSEHIGDHSVSSSMMGKNYLKDPGLKRTILGDGLATVAAGLLGGPVNTTYAENTSVIMLTRVASVYVIKLAAVFAIVMAFFSPIVLFINSIPTPVMGGISIVLFGMIAQNGIRILVNAGVDFTESRNMLIVSVILVFGLGEAFVGFTLFGVDFEFSKMALAAIVGITLHLVLPQKEVAYGMNHGHLDVVDDEL